MFSRLLLLLALIPILACAEVYEPAPGSAERKAIMAAIRLPVSVFVGAEVIFTGTPEVSGNWAKFWGKAAAKPGQKPKPNVVEEMEYDLFALLRKQGGEWKVVSWGYSSDISSYEEARQKFPNAPKELMPKIE